MRGNEKQFKETRLIIVLLAVIIILLFGIIVLLLARGDKPTPVLEPNKVEKKEEQGKNNKDNKEKQNDENEEIIKNEEYLYNFNCEEDGYTKTITIDKNGNAVYQEIKNNNEIVKIETSISNNGLDLLNQYFSSFSNSSQSVSLINYNNGVYEMSIKPEESEAYINLKHNQTITSDDKGYDIYITYEIFNGMLKTIKEIKEDSSNEEHYIVMNFQQY